MAQFQPSSKTHLQGNIEREVVPTPLEDSAVTDFSPAVVDSELGFSTGEVEVVASNDDIGGYFIPPHLRSPVFDVDDEHDGDGEVFEIEKGSRSRFLSGIKVVLKNTTQLKSDSDENQGPYLEDVRAESVYDHDDDQHDDDFDVVEVEKYDDEDQPVKAQERIFADPLLNNRVEVPATIEPVPSPFSGVIAAAAAKTRSALDRRDERRISAQEERERALEETKLRLQETQHQNELRVKDFIDYEHRYTQKVEIDARRDRFFPSPIETRQSGVLGLKNHGLLNDLTRAMVARHQESHTGISWDGDHETLGHVEREQVLYSVSFATRNALDTVKMDPKTELDASKRQRVMDSLPSGPRVQLDRSLRAILPNIYVLPGDQVDDLRKVGIEHREAALHTLVQEVGLQPQEWEISERTRQIRVSSRLLPGDNGYEFDEDWDGIGKIQSACGKTLENESSDGTDYLTTGLIKFSPANSANEGGNIGGATVSLRFTGVEVEKTVPKYGGFEGDGDTSEEYGVQQATPDLLDNPVFRAIFELETRHVQPDIYAWLLQQSEERRSAARGLPHLDKTEFATVFANAIRDVANPNIKRIARGLSETERKTEEYRNRLLEEQGLGRFATNTARQLEAPKNVSEIGWAPPAPSSAHYIEASANTSLIVEADQGSPALARLVNDDEQ